MKHEKEVKELNLVYKDGAVISHMVETYEVVNDNTMLYFYTTDDYRIYIMLNEVRMFNVTEPANAEARQ